MNLGETVLKNIKCYNLAKRKLSLSNDVESNPGPLVNAQHLTICSYNVNGIKDFKKLKRISNFLNKLPFKNNCIINLQETHLTSNEISKLEYQWKWGSYHSFSSGASAGVSILYNKSYFDRIYNQYSANYVSKCMRAPNLGRGTSDYTKTEELLAKMKALAAQVPKSKLPAGLRRLQ